MSTETKLGRYRLHRTMCVGSEITRKEVERDGEYIGTIIYVRRHHKTGSSTYGWRREKSATNSALLIQREAIQQLEDRLRSFCNGG